MNRVEIENMSQPIILFDGICNLCNTSVNFILDRDKKQVFKLAALQSEAGQEILEKYRFPKDYLDTLILIENGNIFFASSAILRIAKKLPLPWSLFYAFILIPTFIRDPVYRFIARNRYKWFGQWEKCRIPTPEIQQRFL